MLDERGEPPPPGDDPDEIGQPRLVGGPGDDHEALEPAVRVPLDEHDLGLGVDLHELGDEVERGQVGDADEALRHLAQQLQREPFVAALLGLVYLDPFLAVGCLDSRVELVYGEAKMVSQELSFVGGESESESEIGKTPYRPHGSGPACRRAEKAL